jgi:hypothetical protein
MQIVPFILLDEKILDVYGLCPYKDDDKISLWIRSQNDNGQLYMYLKGRIIDGVDIASAKNEIKVLDTWFEAFFKDNMTAANLDVLDTIIVYFITFKDKKTKIAKAKHNMILNNLFHLVNASGIPIHLWLEVKYNTSIVHPLGVNTESESLKKYIKNVSAYKEANTKFKQSNKYMENRQKYLMAAYEDYVCSGKNKYKKYIKTSKQNPSYIGDKWSKMTDTQRLDRFEGYISSIMQWKDEASVTSISSTLLDMYTTKQLRYTNIKWNSRMGVIENITNVDFDDNGNPTIIEHVPVVKRVQHEEVFDVTVLNEQLLYHIISCPGMPIEDVLEQVFNDVRVKPSRAMKKVMMENYHVIMNTIKTYPFIED